MTGYVARFWFVYYHDLSGFAVFDDEIKALRYAVENGMQCKEMQYGEDVREQIS